MRQLLFILFVLIIHGPHLLGSTSHAYTEQEVTFINKVENLELKGTLSIPAGDGPFPAVLLVNGTAYGDRISSFDGTLLFGKLATYFADAGYLVLRYDARGLVKTMGEESLASLKEGMDDAMAAYNFLQSQKSVIPNKIGLASYGESSYLSVTIAQKVKPAFLVNLSAFVLSFEEHLKSQASNNLKAAGVSDRTIIKYTDLLHMLLKIIKLEPDSATCQHQLLHLLENHIPYFTEQEKDLLALNKSEIKTLLDQLNNKRVRSMMQSRPLKIYENLQCPVLLIYGDQDNIVPVSKSVSAMHDLLNMKHADELSLVILPNHNHALNRSDQPIEKKPIFDHMLSIEIADTLNKFLLKVSNKETW
jgi:uncharacterized protein